MKYVRNTRSPSRKNTLWPCHSSTPKSASKPSVMVYQGISQPIRAFRRARGVGEGGVAGVQMGQVGDLIGAQGAAAAGVLGPAEHPGLEEGAIDDQLTAALEQIDEAYLALGSVELVPLAHSQPRHPPTLGGQRVTGAGQVLLLHEQLLARSLPFISRHYFLVLYHAR